MKASLLHQETSVTPLTLGVNHRGFHHRLHVKYTKPFYFKNSFIAYKNYQVDWYGDFKNFCDLGDIVITKIKKDENFSQRVLKHTIKIGQVLLRYNHLIITKKLKTVSNSLLAGYLNKLYKLANDICDVGAVAVYPDLRHYKLSTLLKSILRHKIERRKLRKHLNDYLATLLTPPLPSAGQKEKLAVLQLALRIRKNYKLRRLFSISDNKKTIFLLGQKYKQFYIELLKLQQAYTWAAFAHLGPAKQLVDYVAELKKVLKHGDLKLQYKNLLRQPQQISRLQKKYFKELKLTKDENNLFRAARDFSHNKVYRYDVLQNTFYTLDLLLKEIGHRTNFTIMQLRFMSPEEINQLLQGKHPVTKNIIKQRQHFCVTLIRGRGLECLVGKRAKDYIKRNTKKEIIKKEVVTFHGSVAYVGRVSGPVKIVNSVRDIDKVKHGDILVSIQTNPDVLPAMRRAAAFVTDVGGITSHAAIVARELRKPCIIGTKVATKVLHDGDIIEVDAIKGDVRKMN